MYNVDDSLRSKYNPDGSLLRKSQLKMLDMLKFVDEVCSNNEIEYWLDSGTLLGAVRHGGFIPWDDDTDICMTRDNFEKFKSAMAFHKESPYFIQSNETDIDYFPAWAKIRDNSYSGQVDIFIQSDKINDALFRFAKLFYIYLVEKPDKIHIFNKMNRWILFRIIVPFFKAITYKTNSYLHDEYGSVYKDKRSIKNIYPVKRIGFEGIMLNAPNDSEQYLADMFGDWMTLPPEDQRHGH